MVNANQSRKITLFNVYFTLFIHPSKGTVMNQAHQYAENKYQSLRTQAIATAQASLPASFKDIVSLRYIDAEALQQAKIWEARRQGLGNAVPWSFANGYQDWSARRPDRLDVATWNKTTLCGLAIGIPTKTGKSMRLDVIEANPDKTVLSGQVFNIAMTAFEAYADAIGANQIKIMRPVNQKLISLYQQKGFIYQKSWGSNPEHLWKWL
ncbi:hypothetical protein [Rheinheimera baltica]|nr:hypothetical protein [Rheinheimera baltica]MDP5150606.1 hypothetical protein [Rheinheimera baltica]